ncbi:secretory phospholipase A2 [Arthroderma uncinatum]|uniref:secretory phospholipase A2 n=1 Tax=Arthroderma uncinatum TaxID=74035 RepID=UPI00144AEBA7|nr:secretory phospholipase A2 [Arthroderma uncinatum]KAF3491387.1 secretory phospholipase A2 [Arthroderma uncinatum]
MKFSALLLLGISSLAAAAPRPATTACDCGAAVTDRLLFSTTISAFQTARNTQNPPCCDWSSDNCSSSPDMPRGYNFVPSCQRHDYGYRNGKRLNRFTEDYRKKVDDNFKSDLYNYCNQFSGLESWKGVECRRYADIYYFAVRECGDGDCL